jgi:hypothetical protein
MLQLKLIFTIQIGWITLDNASNNDTFLSSLEVQLNADDIDFSCEDQRIRYISFSYNTLYAYYYNI